MKNFRKKLFKTLETSFNQPKQFHIPYSLLGINIDGSEIQGLTIDGENVKEVTLDGNTVWNSTKIVDDFESGNLNDYDGGYTSYFSTVSSPVYEGSNALKGGGSGSNKWITSSSGLSNYPSRGDTFSVWIRGGQSDSQPRTCFGLQDVTDIHSGYGFHADFRDGNIGLLDGNNVQSTDSITWITGKWYRLQCNWGFDTITVKVFDNGTEVASTSYTDSSHDSGGIGFRADHKADPYWDKFYIH